MAADEVVVETCPACTSAVDAQADSCSQCGADLTYFREQARALQEAAETEESGQSKDSSV